MGPKGQSSRPDPTSWGLPCWRREGPHMGDSGMVPGPKRVSAARPESGRTPEQPQAHAQTPPALTSHSQRHTQQYTPAHGHRYRPEDSRETDTAASSHTHTHTQTLARQTCLENSHPPSDTPAPGRTPGGHVQTSHDTLGSHTSTIPNPREQASDTTHTGQQAQGHVVPSLTIHKSQADPDTSRGRTYQAT